MQYFVIRKVLGIKEVSVLYSMIFVVFRYYHVTSLFESGKRLLKTTKIAFMTTTYFRLQ